MVADLKWLTLPTISTCSLTLTLPLNFLTDYVRFKMNFDF